MARNLAAFAAKVQLVKLPVLSKAQLIAYYFQKKNGSADIAFGEIVSAFGDLQFHRPNTSRLKKQLISSRTFVKGSLPDSFRLHATTLNRLDAEFIFEDGPNEEISSSSVILSTSLFINTRGYLEKFAKQINASYEHSIFDGCAILMRRLLELLLILSYKHQGIESLILAAPDQYKDLKSIIADARQNSKLNLSKETKACLDEFREIGNFSAHKLEYNCKRADIERILLKYRVASEELLYRAGLTK